MTIEYGVTREHLRSEHGRGSWAHWLFAFTTDTEPGDADRATFSQHIRDCYPPKSFPGPNISSVRPLGPPRVADDDGKWCTLYEVILRTESTE